jgi:hypothetical protein
MLRETDGANDSEIRPPAPTRGKTECRERPDIADQRARDVGDDHDREHHATTRRQLKRCAAKVIATVMTIPNISAEASVRPRGRRSPADSCPARSRLHDEDLGADDPEQDRADEQAPLVSAVRERSTTTSGHPFLVSGTRSGS